MNLPHRESFRLHLFVRLTQWTVALSFLLTAVHAGQAQQAAAPQERWTEAQANAWYAQQPWPVGANFLPSTAINELEMWQADTFDPTTIDRELGWAQGIGMNTMRVFLHNLLWEQDPEGLREAHRYVSRHRGAASHPAGVCAVRLLLGPDAEAWAAASAYSRRA